LDTHFAPTWAAANVSKQTTAEALQALRDLNPSYGYDEIVLKWNGVLNKVDLRFIEVSQ
jgi:hypothetical protein